MTTNCPFPRIEPACTGIARVIEKCHQFDVNEQEPRLDTAFDNHAMAQRQELELISPLPVVSDGVDDFVQETWLRVLERGESYDGHSRFEYIYGDAKRRQMPAWAWVIAAFLIPNLIGFILYFVFRGPLLGPCSSCGKPIRGGEAFCSHCGCSQGSSIGRITADNRTI